MTPSTTEEQPFITAVCAAPFDNLPRLVCADWLEERGESERAEFIRVQVERAEKEASGRFGPEHLLKLHEREERLLGFAPGGHRPGLKNYDHWFGDWLDTRRSDYGKWLSRGFVSRIECTLAVFMGYECERCGGQRMMTLHGNRISETQGNPFVVQCTTCNGTGHRPGLVDTLFAVQPVTEVVLTDREPWNGFGSPNQSFTWWQPDSFEENAWPETLVPMPLHDWLDWYIKKHARYTAYPTREVALAALSRACVALGRTRANLPAIQWANS